MLRRFLVRLYAVPRLRGPVLWLIRRLEGSEMTSVTLREIFRRYWGVKIGMYTHGGCFTPWMADPETTIGRYSSIAHGVRMINHNHPLSFKGTSGLFFNPALGHCDQWLVEHRPLTVGNDVWVGANAVIMPEVSVIGDGAVIGAGAVVNKDVPPYAVVLGNPGRVVKYRFAEDVIADLLAECWWEADIDELAGRIGEFQTPYTGRSAKREDAEPQPAPVSTSENPSNGRATSESARLRGPGSLQSVTNKSSASEDVSRAIL